MDTEKQLHMRSIDEEQASIENLQATVNGLRELVCFLLIKNQSMRTELMSAKISNCVHESLSTNF
jgi:hypothetical protein